MDADIDESDSLQIICETHSKELVEQLCALVRQGTLRAQDVCFLVVDRNRGEKRIVTRVAVTEDGNFSRSWPTNYFM
jgi:predicted ATPase